MRYRRRPTDVEACQYPGELTGEFRNWADTVGFLPTRLDGDTIHVETITGDEVASPGDWIVRATDGNFSVLPSQIFWSWYERADGHEDIAAWGTEHLKLGSDK